MPYSDNLYSMVDDESDVESTGGVESQIDYAALYYASATGEASGAVVDDHDLVDDAQVHSPVDGFSPSSTSNHTSTSGESSSVLHVPNILVPDPSLEPGSTAESKAREADLERLGNRRLLSTPTLTPQGSTVSADQSFHPQAAEEAVPSQGGPPSAYSSTSSETGVQRGSGIASPSPQAAYYQPSSASAYNPSTASSYTSYTPRRPAFRNSSSVLSREAPPAYTPSPTSPSTAQSTSDSFRNYSTFSQPPSVVYSNMGRLEESQGLLAAHEPQSMGGPEEGLAAGTPDWRERARRRAHCMSGRACKKLFLGLILLLVTTGFLTSMIAGVRDEQPIPPSKEPVTDNPDDKPDMDRPDLDNEFKWQDKYTCQDAQFPRPTRKFDVSFTEDKQFTFIQKTSTRHDDNHRGARFVQVQGTVVFRRTDSDKHADPAAFLDVVVNDDRIDVNVEWDEHLQLLAVTAPRTIPWDQTVGSWPCVSIRGTVWVPEGSALDYLSVKTTQLDIVLLDDLSLDVAQRTVLASTVGHITSASTGDRARDDDIVNGSGAPGTFRFRSRLVEAETTSAPIKGAWPLYDYLGLRSTSGDIGVCVEPKEADEEAPRPAILYVRSNSGSVEVREPVDAAREAVVAGGDDGGDKPEKVLPPRDYRVDMHTTSGKIEGAVAFSSAATFKSTSGSIKIDALPVLDSSFASEDSKEVWIMTQTTSGDTTIDVAEPLWVGEGGKALRCLHGSHTTTSADIKLKYPGAWEGDIYLSAMSGKLAARGKDVQVSSERGDWPGVNRKLVARKGSGGGGSITAKATSGDVDVLVGEV
ncbi:hypothetical protein B0T17DRAFT_485038 [Bombardia bombarda]|uniref:Adhesin domain-containing protein n=1 Tax=Bombardia bombarda TaxID=252184 RepID=A0AA39XIQ5_9PEZI|nr:hypothetical protein B0T17DRAFT_485038 [Bombardia bombarda]